MALAYEINKDRGVEYMKYIKREKVHFLGFNSFRRTSSRKNYHPWNHRVTSFPILLVFCMMKILVDGGRKIFAWFQAEDLACEIANNTLRAAFPQPP
jgi:hypothetical protein